MDVKAYLQAPVPRWLAFATVATTTAAGISATYFYTRKKFYAELDQLVYDSVQKTEKFFASLPEAKPSPVELAKDYESPEEIIEEQAYVSSDDMGDKVEVARNVFTDMKQVEFDQADIDARDPEKPYIITHDEFYESENQMVTLTWYEGDEVLADEKDAHIPDIDRVVGEDNLLRIGYGSGDPNVLYVRNEKMEVDFEVVKNEGKYTEQVLGFIEHAEKIGPRKFRTYDD